MNLDLPADRARELNRESRFLTLCRVGFLGRGLLYILIAWLVLGTGRTEDLTGALAYLNEGSGRLLLLGIGAGMLAYGLWRLADAALNIEGHEPGAKGLGGRLAAAGSGLIYSALAWQSFRLIDGAGMSASDGAEQGARTALALPGGPMLLVAAGTILVGAGLYQLVKVYQCSFCDHLDPAVGRQPWVRWMGRGGYAARGIIFIVSGFFITSAGIEARASEAGGMEDALRWLDSPVDLAVAAGLLLFGLFSLVEARFRIIHEVPLDEVAHAAGLDRRL